MVSIRPGEYGFRTNESLTASEQLQALIDRACDSYRPEPDLGLCLEIAELVNSKKANLPREAAVATVRLINARNQHVSMLALFLLDILVKNCSFPFHLQIATKEFLNELVRRFPERPPPLEPPPMAKILSLIHEWKCTICVTSKHREDLVHIRDMHRLLSYKGYRFPDYDRRAAAVLNPADTLKSPDELEEEDRAAQAAKLQELIRRGTPKDLAAAQQLMKVMSGAEPDKKPDYEAQTRKELQMVQQRVLMLNDMLNNAKPKERFADGDAFDQISQRCKQVQPKLQKWIQEAEERNPEQMDKLLTINDLINQVLERYAAFKRGDRTAVAEIDPGLLKSVTSKVVGKSSKSGQAPPPPAKTAAAQPNLIDFDDFGAEPVASTSSAPSPPSANPSSSGLDALAGLSLGDSGPITQPTAPAAPQQPASDNDLFSLDMSSSSSQPSFSWGAPPSAASPVAGMSGAINLPARPGSTTPATPLSATSTGSQVKPNYFNPAAAPPQGPSTSSFGGGMGMAGGGRQSSTQPHIQQQQQQSAKKDPFEDLLS